MIAFVCSRSPRLLSMASSLVTIALLLSSCTTPSNVRSVPPRPPVLALPTALPETGPTIPFQSPNLLGDPQLTIEPFTELSQIESCLDLGQVVYGIALQNTNVRQAPTLDACRIGRIPRGTLVAITGLVSDAITGTPTIAISTTARLNLPDDTVINRAIFSETIAVTTTTATAATLIPTLVPTAEPPSTRAESSAPAAAVAATGSQVGYVEDIQPIFQRTCIACHSSVVRQLNLQVTAYDPLMAGSSNGPVVIPGDSAASRLWEMVDSGKMPLIGELKPDEKTLIRQWIDSGAPERRTAAVDHDQQANNATASNPAATVASSSAAASPDNTEIAGTESRTGDGESAALWLTVAEESIDPVPDICTDPLDEPAQVVSADLILPISCGVQPRAAQLQRLLQSLAIVPTASRPLPTTAAEAGAFAAAPDVEVSAPPAAAAPPVAAVPQAGLQANALGLDAPADGDPWLTPPGG
ncbi:MAG: hypothetical protein KDE58_39460, partial [Caldilineaceae bacterium]|nr:hypothetical protein [Caldilineaceae bacterium]